jgi:hypothetical protein
MIMLESAQTTLNITTLSITIVSALSVQTILIIMTLSLRKDSDGTLQITLVIMTPNFSKDSDGISANNTRYNDTQQSNR